MVVLWCCLFAEVASGGGTPPVDLLAGPGGRPGLRLSVHSQAPGLIRCPGPPGQARVGVHLAAGLRARQTKHSSAVIGRVLSRSHLAVHPRSRPDMDQRLPAAACPSARYRPCLHPTLPSQHHNTASSAMTRSHDWVAEGRPRRARPCQHGAMAGGQPPRELVP